MKSLTLFLIMSSMVLPIHANRTLEWENIQTWVYQLCNYPNNNLDAIIKSKFDLAVIDLSRDGKKDFFSSAEISNLKASNKYVLSYFEIGAIENYRPEWSLVPAEIKAGPVDGWPQEQYVKYWDAQWWPIVKSRIDQSIKVGFDGIYLDMITTYSEIPNSGFSEQVLADKMVELILKISKYAKSKKTNFKIIPQNCPELYTASYGNSIPNQRYLNAIDGIGFESPFYLAHDKPANKKWCLENRKNALAIRKKGKFVFSVDYAKKPQNIIDSYKKQSEYGFIPYVSVQNLDVISTNWQVSTPGKK